MLESRAAAEIQQNLRFFFSLIKMDSRKYSMYRFFFSIPEDAFILCIGFFDRFRKMLLEAEIIDSVFYVCHRDYICIYRFLAKPLSSEKN